MLNKEDLHKAYAYIDSLDENGLRDYIDQIKRPELLLIWMTYLAIFMIIYVMLVLVKG